MNIAARPGLPGAPFLLALGLSVFYLFVPQLGLPFPVPVVIKGLICPLLAFAIWRQRGGDRIALWLVAALLCSAVGDVFLAVDRVRLFVGGLASFLVAHLFYLGLFWRQRGPLGRRQALFALALLVYGVAMLAVLLPHLGALRLPVLAYMAAILLMGAAALCLPGQPLVGLGAVLFILSDTLIALDKFVLPVPFGGPLIWGSYAAAQLLIVLGWQKRAAPG